MSHYREGPGLGCLRPRYVEQEPRLELMFPASCPKDPLPRTGHTICGPGWVLSPGEGASGWKGCACPNPGLPEQPNSARDLLARAQHPRQGLPGARPRA